MPVKFAVLFRVRGPPKLVVAEEIEKDEPANVALPATVIDELNAVAPVTVRLLPSDAVPVETANDAPLTVRLLASVDTPVTLRLPLRAVAPLVTVSPF